MKYLKLCVMVLLMALVGCGTPADSEQIDTDTNHEQNASNQSSDNGANGDDEQDEEPQNDSENENPVPEDNDTPDVEPTYTYFRDVKPIVDAKCATCHAQGNIAPFTLDTYEEVYPLRHLVKQSVVERTMPPWLAGEDCNEYKADFSLSPEQREVLVQWVDEGAHEGDPSDEGDAIEVEMAGISRVDVTLQMPVEYSPPNDIADDYRCFVIDWPGDKAQYITGFNVNPDNDEVVHHVIAFYAPPSAAHLADENDAAEEGPGYTCFGDPGIGNNVEWLGSWAPGGTGTDFPEGTGLLVEPGGKVIMQMHYNALGSATHTDQSSVEFKVDDEVEHRAFFLPWANPMWLNLPQTMLIPAGNADKSHSFKFDLASEVGRPVTIFSAALHMHLLGTKGTLWIDRKEGEDTCLLDVPRWDFNWQYGFEFTQPQVIYPGDRLSIQCHWDNSQSNQPVINGEQMTPRDVTWGEGTTDEMCLGIFYVVFDELN